MRGPTRVPLYLRFYTSMGLAATTFFHFFSVVFVVYSVHHALFRAIYLHPFTLAAGSRQLLSPLFLLYLYGLPGRRATPMNGPGTKYNRSYFYSRTPRLSTPFALFFCSLTAWRPVR